MLGYVVPLKSEMKVREYEVYSAYYCGICHSIRDRYGQLPRLLLSYDSVFLAMLLNSLTAEPDQIEPFRCLTHPTRKRNGAADNPGISYAADMMLVLGYFNLKDDKEDDHSIIGYAGEKYLRNSYRKIQAVMPEKCARIETCINDHNALEKSRETGLDAISEPFAHLMEEVLDWPGLHDVPPNPGSGIRKEVFSESLSAALRKIGYHLGKWIYLMDAVSDLKKDMETGSFNPLKESDPYAIITKKESKETDREDGRDRDNENETFESAKGIIDRNKERLELLLKLYLSQIAETADLLPIKRNKAIIENIIYLGLSRVTEETLCEPERKKRFYAKSI